MSDKAILRARLASARSDLLWQLLGIPAGILSSEPVVEPLTVTHLLARIATGDNRAATLIEHLLAGKTPVSGSSAPANELLDPGPAEASTHPLSLTLDALLDARSAFLSALARISDNETAGADEIHEWTTAISGERIEQDAEHASTIANWPLRIRTERTYGPKGLLVAAMRAARKELLTSLALLPPEERATRPIRENQTLLDILAHLTDHEAIALETILRVRASESDSSLETGSSAPAKLSLSWQSVWSGLHTTHQELLRALASLDERELSQNLAIVNPGTTIYAMICDCIARDRDQAAAIRQILHI